MVVLIYSNIKFTVFGTPSPNLLDFKKHPSQELHSCELQASVCVWELQKSKTGGENKETNSD